MIARYTRPALTELWSDRHRYDIWLRVELAACREMEAAGSVPVGESWVQVGVPEKRLLSTQVSLLSGPHAS